MANKKWLLACIIFVAVSSSALPVIAHANTSQLYHGEYLYLDDQSNDWIGLPYPMIPNTTINSSTNLIKIGSSYNAALTAPAGFTFDASSNNGSYAITQRDLTNGLISSTDTWMGLTASDGISFYERKISMHPETLPLNITFEDATTGKIVGVTQYSAATSITKTNSKINSNTSAVNGVDVAQSLNLSTVAVPAGYETVSQYSSLPLYSLSFENSQKLMNENYLSTPNLLTDYMLTPSDVNSSNTAFTVTLPVEPIVHTIRAYFVNAAGDNIAAPAQYTGATGSNWTPVLPSVTGYLTPSASTQVVGNSDASVTYTYAADTTNNDKMTITGEDASGKVLYRYEDNTNYQAGENYNIEAPNIQGYDSMTSSLDGTVASNASGNQLIFVYTPDISNTAATNVPSGALNPSISLPTLTTTASGQTGLLLDLTGHAYRVSTIEQFIDELSSKPNSYLQLNLTGNIYTDSNWNWLNSGITMESSVLGQSGNAIMQSGGQWYIKTASTGQPDCVTFPILTKNDLRQIVAYGVSKGVQIIPTIDLPSHAQSLLDQESWSRNSQFYSDLLLPSSNNQAWDTLNYDNALSVTFAEQILSEYLPIFNAQPQRVFAIGGDEIVGADNENDADYPGFANFMNQINQFLNANGFVSRMWNDAITPTNVSLLNKNIQIAYWTTNGATYAGAANSKADIVPAQTLLNDGFQLYNYNGYYLYFEPTQNSLSPGAYAYTLNDLAHTWSIDDFALNNLSAPVTANTQNIMGSAMSLWGATGEENYSDEQIYQDTQSLVTTYLAANN